MFGIRLETEDGVGWLSLERGQSADVSERLKGYMKSLGMCAGFYV